MSNIEEWCWILGELVDWGLVFASKLWILQEWSNLYEEEINHSRKQIIGAIKQGVHLWVVASLTGSWQIILVLMACLPSYYAVQIEDYK